MTGDAAGSQIPLCLKDAMPYHANTEAKVRTLTKRAENAATIYACDHAHFSISHVVLHTHHDTISIGEIVPGRGHEHKIITMGTKCAPLAPPPPPPPISVNIEPSAPPVDYDDLQPPIAIVAVATPLPLSVMELGSVASPSSSSSTNAAATTHTTTIDRIPNPTDGSLSITINSTTHYPNGYREVKIEYYHIPPNMAREVSNSLENGHMPSSSYMIRMEQQTLPPGTEDLTTHPPPLNTALVASSGSTILQPVVRSGNVYYRRGRTSCSIRWCITCTLLCGLLFAVIIVLVGVFVIQPWYFPSSMNNEGSIDDGYGESSISSGGDGGGDSLGSASYPSPASSSNYSFQPTS